MRSTMLASFLSALGLLSFVVSVRGQDTTSILSPVVSVNDTSRLGFDAEGSSRPLKAAPNFYLASSEAVSPSDQVKKAVEPAPSQRADAALGIINPSFLLPYASGPSHGMSSMLRYMSCDPHSCPNIWQGYEAQRAAELAQKCAPPTSRFALGCSCGGACKGSCHLMPAPDCCQIERPINRYRPTQLKAASGCDSCIPTQPEAAGCSSCQANATLPTAPIALNEQSSLR